MEILNKIKEFIKLYWKELIIVVLIFLCFFQYKNNNKVPMTTIQNQSADEIKKAIQDLKIEDKVNPTQVIEKIKEVERKEPEFVYITKTEKEADTKANQLAKQEKADAIIKEKEPVNTNDNSIGSITNKYYSLHLEKNNKIKAGITVLDNKVYENIAYQRKKDELIIHMKVGDANPVKGATYMRTIKEW